MSTHVRESTPLEWRHRKTCLMNAIHLRSVPQDRHLAMHQGRLFSFIHVSLPYYCQPLYYKRYSVSVFRAATTLDLLLRLSLSMVDNSNNFLRSRRRCKRTVGSACRCEQDEFHVFSRQHDQDQKRSHLAYPRQLKYTLFDIPQISKRDFQPRCAPTPTIRFIQSRQTSHCVWPPSASLWAS